MKNEYYLYLAIIIVIIIVVYYYMNNKKKNKKNKFMCGLTDPAANAEMSALKEMGAE